MQVEYPNIIRNAQVSSHTELNNNFQEILDVINKGANPHGNIQGDNMKGTAQLTVGTITISTKIITAVVDCNGTLTIKLPSADGSHSVLFKDHNGNTRLQVKSSGEVEVK